MMYISWKKNNYPLSKLEKKMWQEKYFERQKEELRCGFSRPKEPDMLVVRERLALSN